MSLHDCVCDICWRLSTAFALNFNVIGQKGTPCLTGWDMACCDQANTEDVKSVVFKVSRVDKDVFEADQ